MPAQYWRFDGAYQDAPEPPAPCQLIMAGCVQTCPPPWACSPWQGFPGWQFPPAYIQGPIYVDGLATPPPAYGVVRPPPPDAGEKLPPPPTEEAKKYGKKDVPKRKENPATPPKMPEGANYMFDREHTMLHIFGNTHPVWEPKYKDAPRKFKIFKVSVNFTVKMVIENVLRKDGDACKGWAATEAVEIGGGKWAKGSTIEYDSDRSNGTLKQMAWTTKRGDGLPPVWLVVHKV